MGVNGLRADDIIKFLGQYFAKRERSRQIVQRRHNIVRRKKTAAGEHDVISKFEAPDLRILA